MKYDKITKNLLIESNEEFYKKNNVNNWLGTPWEGYIQLGAKQKGVLGEKITETVLGEYGHEVKPPLDTGHDRIVDGLKTEIKFGLAISSTKKDGKKIDPDNFMFNHIAVGKNWEIFVFFGVNPEKTNKNTRKTNDDYPQYRIYTMAKKDFKEHLNKRNTYPFKKQQGGKKQDNDDYIIAGKKACEALFKLSFVKEYKGVL